jgi:hypothetical protein
VRHSTVTNRFRIPLVLLLLLVVSPVLLECASRPAVQGNAFDLFTALDHQLSAFDLKMQQAKIPVTKTANPPSATPRQAPRPWALAARSMQPSVTAILRDSYRLERAYHPREARLHRPLFRRLYKHARTLRGDLRLLSEARTSRWARVVQARLSKALVAYVFDFQLVSGGYAALRCQAEQVACCEPVRKDLRGPFSCKWACVKQDSSCRSGFPGPQIGPGFEQPLSAAR